MNNFFGSVINGQLTITTYLMCTGAALLCGIITALCTRIRGSLTKSFMLSLVLLPPVVETVIFMVNGNVGTGIAVAGAFSLVRFRSVPGKARDITAIFSVMTSGIACAAGYIGIAIVYTLFIGIITVVFAFIKVNSENMLDLRITIPESLNFEGVFDDLFKKYTKSYEVTEVKTTNMGSLYKLTYKISPKPNISQKDFLDELRVRNGNLEISLCRSCGRSEEL